AELSPTRTDFVGATFLENRAENGGAVFLINGGKAYNFVSVNFQSNSASATGGAFTAHSSILDQPVGFLWCNFLRNVAGETGGAVEILSG
ncbi:unnamed protein product, partial [Ectocarpus sp. 12 AP-2014]